MSISEFQVGDRVKIIDDWYRNNYFYRTTKETIFIVESVDREESFDRICLYFEGHVCGCYTRRCRKIESSLQMVFDFGEVL